MIDQAYEKELREAAAPHLKKARKGDWEHTLRAVAYGEALLRSEQGDENIVIPALYLHDTGWSCVDFRDFLDAPPGEKGLTDSVRQHMRYSAMLADQILLRLGTPLEERRRICSIISIHDVPERIFSVKDPAAWRVLESDYLDRFGPQSLGRYAIMMGKDIREHWMGDRDISFLKNGLNSWFKSRTAKEIANRLVSEFSWEDALNRKRSGT